MSLAYVDSKLAFTTPKTSLMDYYLYQRIEGLNDTTANKLLVNVNATLLSDQ
jgi:hypothetical protein